MSRLHRNNAHFMASYYFSHRLHYINAHKDKIEFVQFYKQSLGLVFQAS